MPVQKATKVNKVKDNRPNIFKQTNREKHAGVKFWMDDYSYRRLYDSKPEDSLDKLLSLWSIKRTIANFVQITSNTPVKVKYAGTKSYVDPQRCVTISSDLKDYDGVVGLALHESSHISYSVLDIYHKLWELVEKSFKNKMIPAISTKPYDKLIQSYWNIFKNGSAFNAYDWNAGLLLFGNWKNLINWIEDRRIDYKQSQRFPGYVQYYEKLYGKYFYSEIITEGLQSSLKRTQTFDSYMFRLLNSINPGSDDTALPNLDKMIEKLSMTNINNCQDNFETAQLGLELFEMIWNECKQNQKPNGEPQTDKEKIEQERITKAEKEQERELEEIKKELEKEKKENSEKNEENSDSESDENDESKSEETDDETEDEDESEEGNGGNEESEDETEDEGNGDSEDDNEDEGDNEYNEADEQIRGEIEKVMERIEKLLDADDSLKTPISDTTAEKMKLLETGDLKIEKPSMWKMTAQVISIEKLSEDVVKSFQHLFMYDSDTKSRILKGIKQGVVLGKKLQIMNDERIISTLRKRTGKIDQRLLPEIGFNNERIFSHTSREEYHNLYVHLTLDSSGSMRGEAWRQTVQMAAAFAVALRFVEGSRVIVSTRSTVTINNCDNAYNLIIYDSKVNDINHIRKWWHRLYASGNTPEGFVFDALMNRILKDANGTDAYFINVSDGMPSCGVTNWSGAYPQETDYSGWDALEHTRQQVDKLVKNNITVISYYVSDRPATSNVNFEKMYGKYAHYIQITDMVKLASTLNKRFIQRNRVTK